MPGAALSFEVQCGSVECHSKIKGGGFISTKEKLLRCVKKIIVVLGVNDAAVQRNRSTASSSPSSQEETHGLSQEVPDAHGLVCQRPTKMKKKGKAEVVAATARKQSNEPSL